MPRIVRKTATKVADGQVDRKSRSTLSEIDDCWIRKEPAGKGYTHVVSQRQLEKFIALIPDWNHWSYRLRGILLQHGERDVFGSHFFSRRLHAGVIALCAWPSELSIDLPEEYFHEHREVLAVLGVRFSRKADGMKCNFTVAQARAFMLLHVFLHELGHHRDRHRRPAYGLKGREEFAEHFANQWLADLLPRYIVAFGDPAVLVKNISTEGEDDCLPEDETKATIRSWGHKPIG